ncbi:LysR family transcriptional regulator [Sulfitobacter sp. D35]|uniref:LysR family transcriptional regulator n=1 Tax=Sulfitobacter sp. D35 TaxID=3083252 RepID=UPI00296FD2C7|nr:LysR family transcriptional regulator [Sulfitobacter sp. D35]MDW4500391.1 LysR family transcriptional regulator [Sulfitobacter sp. D35]
MDNRLADFDWMQARAFLAVAEAGSLTAAARVLGLAQPTLGRQIRALEADIGVALFERAGRGLTLTPTGLDLLEHVRTMDAAAQRFARVASGRSEVLEGRIVITASEMIAGYTLPPIIAALRRAHPGIQVDLLPSNAAKDLQRREADIAIRNFRPTQPDLVARKIREDRAGFYATPECFERFGRPETLADLARAEFIGFDAGDGMIEAMNGLGLAVTEANLTLRGGNHFVCWALCLEGLGIGVVPEEVGDAEKRVVRVLPAFDRMVYPLWLTSHREVRTSRRVRVVFDFLAEALSRNA